ncbi:MAG: hypothetical protein PHC34_11425 [Candidatus Gastranaerophilales bacterium]|nr:hypothetical protein [Candidatus Gastranaerophilales bacterium]
MNAKNLIKFLFSYTALFILLVIFVLLTLYTLNTMSKVFFLIAEYIRISIYEENLNAEINTFEMILKVGSITIAFYLLFILYSVISAVATYKAYEIAALKYSYKKPDLEEVFFKTISWNFYRLIYVLSPLLTIGTVIGSLFFLNIILFNEILSLAGFSIALVTFLTSFISISLAVGFIFVLGLTIWNIFITLFGMECVVSEPELNNNVIRKRSRKLSLAQKSNIKIYFFYTIFILALIVQFTGVILFPDILNEENLIILTAFIVIDIIFFIGLGYLKSSLYINSLLYKYDTIIFKDKNSLKELVSEW